MCLYDQRVTFTDVANFGNLQRPHLTYLIGARPNYSKQSLLSATVATCQTHHLQGSWFANPVKPIDIPIEKMNHIQSSEFYWHSKIG